MKFSAKFKLMLEISSFESKYHIINLETPNWLGTLKSRAYTTFEMTRIIFVTQKNNYQSLSTVKIIENS